MFISKFATLRDYFQFFYFNTHLYFKLPSFRIPLFLHFVSLFFNVLILSLWWFLSWFFSVPELLIHFFLFHRILYVAIALLVIWWILQLGNFTSYYIFFGYLITYDLYGSQSFFKYFSLNFTWYACRNYITPF